MEAHDAYACKLILGLCHSPPRLENQSGSWKIENLMEEKKQFHFEMVSIPKNLLCREKMDADV